MKNRLLRAGSTRPQVIRSEYGEIVESWINKINDKYPAVDIENSVVMPNHMHMILKLKNKSNDYCGRVNPAPTDHQITVGKIIGYFKYQTTKEIGFEFWQRSYHDHIIRDEEEYQKIRQYIRTNPQNWKDDIYFVEQI